MTKGLSFAMSSILCLVAFLGNANAEIVNTSTVRNMNVSLLSYLPITATYYFYHYKVTTGNLYTSTHIRVWLW